MEPLPLFGSSVASYSKSVSAQRRLNVIVDPRPDGDGGSVAFIGTFGTILFAALPTYPVRGWHVVGNLMYVVSGQSLYSVSPAGTVTFLGTVPGNNKVAMDDNFVQLAIVNGAALYCYTIVTGSYQQAALNAAGSFAAVADANFPNGATTIAFIDGRFIVEQFGSRQYFVSGSYDVTAWGANTAISSLIYFSKENYPDIGLAVSVFNSLVILWGDTSIEFWQDAGGSPLPYARVQGATQQWGLAAKWSRAAVNNSMIFLAKNPGGLYKVITLGGYSPVPVSTPDIDAILNDLSVVSDAVALTYTVYGHALYQLTFPTANRSLLYDATTNIWSETQTGLGLTGRHIGELGTTFNSQNYCSDASNGNIYQFYDLAYSDNGQPIKRQLTSKHIRNRGADLGVGQLYIEMETGVGLQSGQGSNPMMSLEVSKDGGHTFGLPRSKPIGLVGQYKTPRAKWNRCGMSRDFVFRFTVTDPVKFVVTGGMAAELYI
jgi:hypothetical protein